MTTTSHVTPAALTPETTAALTHLGDLLANDLPDVEPGHMWRANWDGVTSIGIVLDTDEDDIAEFAPLTVDVDYADPYTGLVEAADNPLNVQIAVFAGLTTPLCTFTLDKWFGALNERHTATLHALWRANLSGLPPKDPSLRVGTPDIDAADPKRDYRNELRAETAHIQAAELAEHDATQIDVDLPQRLADASLAPSDLVTDKVPLSYARQAAEGNTAINADLAQRIAYLLNEPDPSRFENDGPALPEALAACLTTPRRFRVVREIMDSEDLNETAAARRIPAIVKYRRIQQEQGQTDTQFWCHALDLIESSEKP